MNTKLKCLSTSLAIIAMFSGGVLYASTVADDNAVVQPGVGPVMEPVLGDGKDKEDMVVVPAGPALLSAADLLQLTEFITNMKTFRDTVKSLDGKSDADREAALMHAILAQGGVAQESTNLLNVLIQKINIIVQGVNSAPDSKCRSCQVCFASTAHGADYAAQEFNRLFPLIDRYYRLISQVEAEQGADAMSYITALVEAGVMKDLTYLLEFTDRYKEYEVLTKAKAIQNAKRPAMFRAKAAAPAPIKPLVKAAVVDAEGVEAIGGAAVVSEGEPAVAAPTQPVLTAQDLVQLTEFMAAIKKFRAQVKLNEGKDNNAREVALMEAILENGGLASESLGFLSLLAKKVNVLVQSVDAAPNSSMKKCQSCWQKTTVGTTFGLDELNQVLPLITKYYDLAKSLEDKGSADAIDFMDEFVKAGVLKDLTYLVNFTERYKAYEVNVRKKEDEEKIARNEKRAALTAKRSLKLAKKAPKKIVVAPVVDAAKPVEMAPVIDAAKPVEMAPVSDAVLEEVKN